MMVEHNVRRKGTKKVYEQQITFDYVLATAINIYQQMNADGKRRVQKKTRLSARTIRSYYWLAKPLATKKASDRVPSKMNRRKLLTAIFGYDVVRAINRNSVKSISMYDVDDELLNWVEYITNKYDRPVFFMTFRYYNENDGNVLITNTPYSNPSDYTHDDVYRWYSDFIRALTESYLYIKDWRIMDISISFITTYAPPIDKSIKMPWEI